MEKKASIILSLICLYSFAPTASGALVICPSLVDAPKHVQDKHQAECKKNQEDSRIYGERSRTLAPYQQFFSEFGVNLTTGTSEEQYKYWHEGLIHAKNNYENKQKEIIDQKEAEEKRRMELIEQEKIERIRKENEAQEKIIELENRIKNLESQKTDIIVNSPQVINNTPNTVIPPSKLVDKKPQAVVKKNESVLSIQNDIPASGTSTIVVSEPQVPIRKVGWFTKVINWFRLR